MNSKRQFIPRTPTKEIQFHEEWVLIRRSRSATIRCVIRCKVKESEMPFDTEFYLRDHILECQQKRTLIATSAELSDQQK